MALVWEGFRQALGLLWSVDRELLAITWLSLRVSGSATLMAIVLGMPVGLWLGLSRFRGRRFLLGVVNTGMGLPPVVVGLFISILLWRSGPLGAWDLLYTPLAMIMAQAVIAFPIVTGLTCAAVQQLDPRIALQALALGASGIQLVWTLAREARLPLLAAIMAGFGGVISEVGAVMMVGGNIRGQTRVLTTATVLEARMGRFDTAIALSVILLGLVFVVNAVLTIAQQQEVRPWRRLP
ncbi:MAG: ABC transporter permease [Bacillota bacterium]